MPPELERKGASLHFAESYSVRPGTRVAIQHVHLSQEMFFGTPGVTCRRVILMRSMNFAVRNENQVISRKALNICPR